jgi:hypothetical protein
MLYDRTLIQIRERSFLDLLDLSLYVVRARPIVLALTALVGIAPWAALNYWLLSDPDFTLALWIMLLILEVPWATAPLTLVLGDLMFEVPPKPSRILKTLLVRFPALLVGQLLVRGIMLATVICYPFMPAQYAYLNEVILLEQVPGHRQFRRSRTLNRGFEGESFVRWLGQLFLGTIFVYCFWTCAHVLGGALIGNDLTWANPGLGDVSGALFQAGTWIAVAFFGVYRFFAYIDRRIRLEGWELDLRLKAVARGLEARGD